MAERRENPISRNKKNYRPTKSGAGMTRAGVKAYRRANPGSKLKTAVTGKVKPGSKAANRRKSYCARSLGQLKRSSAKTLNRRIEALAISVTSGGVDNMETYKYIIGQINALESVRQEISNLQQDKELNENRGTVINIKPKNNNSK